MTAHLADTTTGLLEQAQVLHHPEAGHREAGLQLGQRLPVAPEEQVEQQPPGGIRQGLEHPVVVHASKNR